MNSNEVLNNKLEQALAYEPLLHNAQIHVSTASGIVTLSGVLDSYLKKTSALAAAADTAGVRAVVDHLEVQPSKLDRKTDAAIAEGVLWKLRRCIILPAARIRVCVKDGWVTLSGVLPYFYQRDIAKAEIQSIAGIKGVVNNIVIETEVEDEVKKKIILQAYERHWSIKPRFIHVEASNGNVTLSGMVCSAYQSREAERIAWSTRGVRSVNNQLEVDYHYGMISDFQTN